MSEMEERLHKVFVGAVAANVPDATCIIDGIAEITRLRLSPDRGGERRDLVYLIERKTTPPQYATERSDLPAWHSDPWRAHRYATAREAQDAHTRLLTERDNSVVVEHLFIYPPVGRSAAEGTSPDRAAIIEECAKAVESQGFYRDESGERAAEIIRALAKEGQG